MSSHRSSTTSLRSDLELFEVKPGVRFSLSVLQTMLPDDETLLFFGKLYELDASQLTSLLTKVRGHYDLVRVLNEGGHSTELQSYLVDIADQMPEATVMLSFDAGVQPRGEILAEVWKNLEVEVASSIKEVASKLEGVIGNLPGKKAEMVFKSMAVMNKKQPKLGDYRATITRGRRQPNLIILDDSGSMSRGTVVSLLSDVVGMAYMADAHLALVSSSTRVWEPGAYGVQGVQDSLELGGTHYETLQPLLRHTWGTVVTIADYDSSHSAKDYLAANVTGSIDTVVDISLVNRPTFLAECVGQFAKKVQPILIGQTYYPLGSGY